MSMDKETQEKFAMFYGMANAVGDLYEPVEMPDEDRVAKAKAVFVEKLNADQAIALGRAAGLGRGAKPGTTPPGTGNATSRPSTINSTRNTISVRNVCSGASSTGRPTQRVRP